MKSRFPNQEIVLTVIPERIKNYSLMFCQSYFFSAARYFSGFSSKAFLQPAAQK